MDFAFFESLSPAEAQAFLDNYLRVEREAIKKMITAAKNDGIEADFTIQSVSPVLKWILKKISTVPLQPDETLPKWIQESDSYIQGLIDFKEPSKTLVLRGSYYLGESFIRYAEVLTWATGDRETVVENMPVVTGFQYKKEMAPMMILENLFLRILAYGASSEDIDRAIKKWLSFVPNK